MSFVYNPFTGEFDKFNKLWTLDTTDDRITPTNSDNDVKFVQDGVATAVNFGVPSHSIRMEAEGWDIPGAVGFDTSCTILNYEPIGQTEQVGNFSLLFNDTLRFITNIDGFVFVGDFAGGGTYAYGASLAPTGKGTTLTFLAGGAAAGNNDGGDLTLTGGAPFGNGDGGDVELTGGDSAAGGSGSGGSVVLTGGNAGVGGGGDGGDIAITGGINDGAGTHGKINIGIGTPGVNYATTWNGATNQGTLTWTDVANRFDFDSFVGFNESFNIFRVEPPAPPTVALAGVGAGNVDNGAHSYSISYDTADGHTERGAETIITVVDKTADGQVEVTLPIGTDSRITGRTIHRTRAGVPANRKLLATIADNTTTTYIDNTADAGLGAATSEYDNTSLRVLDEDDDTICMWGESNTSFGENALANITTGARNTACGNDAGEDLTQGFANCLFGSSAAPNITTGEGNCVFGALTANSVTTGDRNVIIGQSAQFSNNVSRVVCIGYNAGFNNSSNDRLFIDVSNTATPLIYGEFDNDKLIFNCAANLAQLSTQPTGGVDLAIATTKYVNDEVGKRRTTRIINTASPYSLLSTDVDLFADTDGGPITVNLPVGSDEQSYRIINCGSSGNNITLTPNGAELLKGVNASMTITDGNDLLITYETTEGWF